MLKPPCVDFSAPLAGRWLLDGDVKARVDFLECPLVSSSYACRYLGTPHAHDAARLRFAPDKCRLEPFCAEAFVRWLARRKLVVTGDSHARQALASLACKLYKAHHVRSIQGPCQEMTGNRGRCASFGQYAQDRKLCGPTHCTFDPAGPAALKQSGLAAGTDIFLTGGGSLHLREVAGGDTGLHRSSDRMRKFYNALLPALVASMNMTRNDTLVVSDMSAHRLSDPAGLYLAARSLVAYQRRAKDPPRIVWLDYQAPHFAMNGTFSGPSGEYNGGNTCVGRTPPAPAVVSDAGVCSAHTCDSVGAGAGAVQVLQGEGLEVVHSFHANRLVHIGHSGASWINYSRWKIPDCHHVCSPSGAEELRTSLLVNMLLSSQSRGVKRAMPKQTSAAWYKREEWNEKDGPSPLRQKWQAWHNAWLVRRRRQEAFKANQERKVAVSARSKAMAKAHKQAPNLTSSGGSSSRRACEQRRTVASRRSCRLRSRKVVP